jgi:dephospho-CoA kinase
MNASHLVIALTGGVASGKSVVERCFEALGIRAYDADKAARAVVEPGMPALDDIALAFGADALDAEGRLDRRAMRERIFADTAERLRLEAILHPRIRVWLREQVAADTGPYCLLSVPLLVENRESYRWVDRVLVVDVPETVQIERLILRDGVDTALAMRMLANQATRAERLAIADDVIGNTGTEAELAGKVASLHARYLTLSAHAD